MTEAPKTKAEFYARYSLGEFGNRPASWSSASELASSGFSGKVTARSTTPGGACIYGISAADAVLLYPDSRFNESMPDEELLIQGELFTDHYGRILLTYSTKRGVSMRDAMKSPREAIGSAALAILRHYLWPPSFDDVVELMRETGGVVEFGAYQRPVGSIPHRNAVIWEVRNY